MRFLINKTDGIGGMGSIGNCPNPEDFEEAIRKWKLSWPGRYISHREILPSEVPTDRTFRDALVDTGAKIACDIPRAREILKDSLRVDRVLKLAALDTAYMRADEMGDAAEKQRISALKQVLRDVTKNPAIEAARTTEALKLLLP